MKNKGLCISFLGIFLALIFVASILADDPTNVSSATAAATSTELKEFLDVSTIQVNFYSNVVNSMTALVPSDTLTADVSALQSDLTQIQTYVTSGDRDSMKQFVQNTFQPDLNKIKQDILTWRQTNVKSLTMAQKVSLLSNFTQSVSNFKTNRFNEDKNFATGRINYFNNVLSVYQNRIDSLQSKGIDVSSLTQLLADARSTILVPLENAINSSTDSSSLNQAIKQYALFDGSQNGINFHLAAKFDVDLLQIALTKLSSNSNVPQASITQLQNDINTANTALTQVGTAAYTQSQETQIWNAIKDGFSIVKSASNSATPQVNSTTAGNSS